MPELDTVRGIAVLMVCFFHGFGFIFPPAALATLSGFGKVLVYASMAGWLGVNLFFVLSGFLITGILLDGQSKPQYFRNFYLRRALRILPAYYAVLLALPLLSRIPRMEYPVGWSFVGFSVIYLANCTDLFGVNMQYGPLWSLAVEEHFYLLWPAIVRHLTVRRVGAVALSIVALSPAVRLWTIHLGISWAGTVRTWNSFDGLAMGAFLAALVRSRYGSRHCLRIAAVSAVALFATLVVIGRPYGILTNDTLAPGRSLRGTAIALLFFALLLCVLLLGTSRWRRIVDIKWLKFFGFISYGLYLIHLIVFELFDAFVLAHWPHWNRLYLPHLWVRFCCVLMVSSVVAWISRRTFEEFFLRWKDKLDAPKLVTAKACSAAGAN